MDHKELDVWKKSMDFVESIYAISNQSRLKSVSDLQVRYEEPLFPSPRISLKGQREKVIKSLFNLSV
jgi:hypothetical protein